MLLTVGSFWLSVMFQSADSKVWLVFYRRLSAVNKKNPHLNPELDLLKIAAL